MTESRIVPKKIKVAFDWKSAELYILCCMSKDDRLYEVLQQPGPHSFTAMKVLDLPEMPGHDSDKRDLMKTITYALIYAGFQLDTSCDAILRSKPNLDREYLMSCLNRYKDYFHKLFKFMTEDALQASLDNSGVVTYLLGAKKDVRYPEYIRELKQAQRHSCGRLALSVLGQNSCGLLLKTVIANAWRNKFLREKMEQIVPVFDALHFQTDTESVVDVITALEKYATPILQNGDFKIRMKTEWKASLKSWGDMKQISWMPEVPDEKALVYPLYGK